MPLTTGETILNGKYRVVELLGKGAFAHVYRARHEALKRDVAIKTLRHGEEGVGSTRLSAYRDRFQLEAELGAQFDDPHLIRVYDFEEENGALYLVMEYCPGGSLQKRLEEGPLPVEDAVRMAREVAEGLALLHQHRPQIVHRDLKPSNILLGADGVWKVADLGLAQVPTRTSARSALGSVADWHPGTPEYKSPEQADTMDYLQPPSDVWALGAVLFEVLTGEMYKAKRPGTRVRELRSEVPEWLDELVALCLSEDKKARPWEGAEVAVALGEGLAEAEGVRREAEEAAQREAAEAARRKAEEVEGLEQGSPEVERIERGAQRVKREEVRRQREAEEARRKAEEKARKEMTITLAPGVEMVFVRVPAGEFSMGSTDDDPGAFDDEKPQHRVHLDEYWMGKYPVTNAQYAAFEKATGARVPRHWKRRRIPAGKEKHPVVNVSWKDAQAFCRWAGGLAGGLVRLPTEAEWEKAARGTDGRIWPWGNQPPDATRCNFEKIVGDTTPVGEYSPRGDSPYGCADMAGNVWEWVGDWHDSDYYSRSPERNPAGPASGSYRVLRGGSWSNDEGNVRSALRCNYDPACRHNLIGFRCARSS